MTTSRSRLSRRTLRHPRFSRPPEIFQRSPKSTKATGTGELGRCGDYFNEYKTLLSHMIRSAAKAIPHAATADHGSDRGAPPKRFGVLATSSEQAILSYKSVQRLTANLGDAPVLVTTSPH